MKINSGKPVNNDGLINNKTGQKKDNDTVAVLSDDKHVASKEASQSLRSYFTSSQISFGKKIEEQGRRNNLKH